MFSFEGWVLRLKEVWELITSQCPNFQVIKKKVVFSGFKSFSQSLESELTSDLCFLALNSLSCLVYTLPLHQEQPYHILRGQSVPCSNFSICFPLQQKECAIRKKPADKSETYQHSRGRKLPGLSTRLGHRREERKVLKNPRKRSSPSWSHY